MAEEVKRTSGMTEEEVRVLDMFAASAVAGLLSRKDIMSEEDCKYGDFPGTTEYGVAEVAYRIAGKCLRYRKEMIEVGMYGGDMR